MFINSENKKLFVEISDI